MKMRRRLGESPGPVGVCGPLIVTDAIAGCVPRLRVRGRSVASSRASVRWMNATPIEPRPGRERQRELEARSAGAPPRPPRPPPRAPPTGSIVARAPSTVTSSWCASRGAPASSTFTT